MPGSSRRSGLVVLSVLVGAMPFAFGVIRAVETGRDLRYLWLAVVSFLGAWAVMTIGTARARYPRTVLVLAAMAFGVALLLGVVTARLLGVMAGPGMWVVCGAFALCAAASRALAALARPRMG